LRMPLFQNGELPPQSQVHQGQIEARTGRSDKQDVQESSKRSMRPVLRVDRLKCIHNPLA
jgi:hypothetical protein